MKNFFNSKLSGQIWWNSAQLGLLIFPLIPIVGAIFLFLALVGNGYQQIKTISRRPLNWGLAVLSIWLAITASLAFQPSEAFLGLVNLLPFFLLLASFSELIKTPAQLRRIAWLLVLPSLPIIILGFGQLFLGWGISGFWADVFGWTTIPYGNPLGRMASIFMYANILAAYLTIVFILSLGLLIEALQPHPPTPSPGTERGRMRMRGFLFVVVGGNAIALILTNSRNAWIIALIACLAYGIYLGWRWLVAIVTGVAASLLGAAFGPPPVGDWLRAIVPAFFWARLNDQMYADRPVALMRKTQWEFAWSLAQQHPWTGWGLRNFTPLYQAKMQLWLGHPHSLFLMLAAEIGFPATLFFCGLIGWVMAQAVFLLQIWLGKNQDKFIFFTLILAFGGCVMFNTVDVTLFDLRVNTLGWLLLAAISGVVSHNRTRVEEVSGGDR